MNETSSRGFHFSTRSTFLVCIPTNTNTAYFTNTFTLPAHHEKRDKRKIRERTFRAFELSR